MVCAILGSQKQAGICEFEASLVHLASSRPAMAIKKDLDLKKKRKGKKCSADRQAI